MLPSQSCLRLVRRGSRGRERVAKLIGAQNPKEIVFTSGATESDNLAIKGACEFYKDKGDPRRHHGDRAQGRSRYLQAFGATGRFCDLRRSRQGWSRNPNDIRRAITPKTILVSVMLANNEVRTIQPIAEIGAIAREHNVLLHCDAVQGIKNRVRCAEDECDLASLTASRIYGPKGIGALYVRRARPAFRLAQQMDGGGHERGNRSGTLNVPGIVGFGKAADILVHEGKEGWGGEFSPCESVFGTDSPPPSRK